METWKKVRLCDIAQINKNNYSNKEKWNFINYLDTGNITLNKIDSIKYIDLEIEKLPSRAKRKVSYNSIVYSTVRPNQLHYGIIKEQPQNFLVSTGFTVIDVDEKKANPDFIYYALTKSEVIDNLQAIGEQTVSAYPSIKPSDLSNLELSIPSIEVQYRIVAILENLESKIRINEKINDNLFELGNNLIKKYLNDTQIPLSDFATIISKGTTPTKNDVNKYINNINIKYIKVKDFNDFGIDVSNLEYISEDIHKGKLKRSILKVNDILISIAGTLGKVAIVDEFLNNSNTNQAVAFIRLKDTHNIGFIYFFMKSLKFKEEIIKREIHAVQPNLSLGELGKIKIPIPRDIKLFNSLLNKIQQNLRECDKLEQLRDTLLPKLMNGEIDLDKIEI